LSNTCSAASSTGTPERHFSNTRVVPAPYPRRRSCNASIRWAAVSALNPFASRMASASAIISWVSSV
jgi:hypothetical protein